MVPSKPRNFSHLVLPGTTMDLPATSEKPRPPALPWAQFTSSDPSTIPAPKVIIKQETKRRAAEPWGMRRWTCWETSVQDMSLVFFPVVFLNKYFFNMKFEEISLKHMVAMHVVSEGTTFESKPGTC